jgi:hypothetical protein
LFFAGFSALPLEAAKALWYILMWAFAAASFFLSSRLLAAEPGKKTALISLSFLTLLKFLGREVELGQANLLIIFALTLMLFLYLRGKETAAGLLWGFSLFFKPYALVFAPYLALKKSFKTLAAGISLLLAGLAVPSLFYGLRGNIQVLKEWPSTLSRSTAGLLSVYDNASLPAFFLKILGPSGSKIAGMIFAGALAVLASVFFWMIRRGIRSSASLRPEVLECSFLFILIPYLSPLGWNYNYLYSLLAVMLLLRVFPLFPRLLQIVLAINFAVVGTSVVEVWGRGLFDFYTRHSLVVINYAIILFALFYLRKSRQV